MSQWLKKNVIDNKSEMVWGKVNELTKSGKSHGNIFRTGNADFNSDDMSQSL